MLQVDSPRFCNCCATTKSASEFYPSYKTQCRACLKRKAAPKRAAKLAYLVEWRAMNPDAAKEWYRSNRDSKRKYNAVYYSERREHERRRYDAWARANPGKVNSLIARRTAAKMRQTPAWADHHAIVSIYERAAELTRLTGIRHEVDHIIPLQGATVCGLHWEANLQILTKTENLRKWNRLLPEYAPC